MPTNQFPAPPAKQLPARPLRSRPNAVRPLFCHYYVLSHAVRHSFCISSGIPLRVRVKARLGPNRACSAERTKALIVSVLRWGLRLMVVGQMAVEAMQILRASNVFFVVLRTRPRTVSPALLNPKLPGEARRRLPLARDRHVAQLRNAIRERRMRAEQAGENLARRERLHDAQRRCRRRNIHRNSLVVSAQAFRARGSGRKDGRPFAPRSVRLIFALPRNTQLQQQRSERREESASGCAASPPPRSSASPPPPNIIPNPIRRNPGDRAGNASPQSRTSECRSSARAKARARSRLRVLRRPSIPSGPASQPPTHGSDCGPWRTHSAPPAESDTASASADSLSQPDAPSPRKGAAIARG